MKIDERLKSIMEEKGLTITQLSKLSGVRPQRISDWRNGVSVRDFKQLKSVTSELGVLIDDILFEQNKSFINGQEEINLETEWSTGLYEIKFRKINRKEFK